MNYRQLILLLTHSIAFVCLLVLAQPAFADAVCNPRLVQKIEAAKAQLGSVCREIADKGDRTPSTCYRMLTARCLTSGNTIKETKAFMCQGYQKADKLLKQEGHEKGLVNQQSAQDKATDLSASASFIHGNMQKRAEILSKKIAGVTKATLVVAGQKECRTPEYKGYAMRINAPMKTLLGNVNDYKLEKTGDVGQSNNNAETTANNSINTTAATDVVTARDEKDSIVEDEDNSSDVFLIGTGLVGAGALAYLLLSDEGKDSGAGSAGPANDTYGSMASDVTGGGASGGTGKPSKEVLKQIKNAKEKGQPIKTSLIGEIDPRFSDLTQANILEIINRVPKCHHDVISGISFRLNPKMESGGAYSRRVFPSGGAGRSVGEDCLPGRAYGKSKVVTFREGCPTWPSFMPQYLVAHEIGHVIDKKPVVQQALRRAKPRGVRIYGCAKKYAKAASASEQMAEAICYILTGKTPPNEGIRVAVSKMRPAILCR